MGYLDDIIMFSNNELEHLEHIEEIFKRLECFGLKMKREKCYFIKKTHSILRPFNSRRRFYTTPGETRKHT